MNVVPAPGVLSTEIAPPCAWTIHPEGTYGSPPRSDPSWRPVVQKCDHSFVARPTAALPAVPDYRPRCDWTGLDRSHATAACVYRVAAKSCPADLGAVPRRRFPVMPHPAAVAAPAATSLPGESKHCCCALRQPSSALGQEMQQVAVAGTAQGARGGASQRREEGERVWFMSEIPEYSIALETASTLQIFTRHYPAAT